MRPVNARTSPVAAGFLYLVAIMDWASRHVLAWRLSNTMNTGFCIEALEAVLRTGTPDIFNTDQGAQFTSAAITGGSHTTPSAQHASPAASRPSSALSSRAGNCDEAWNGTSRAVS